MFSFVGHVVLAETTWVLRTVYGLVPSAIGAEVNALLAHRSIVTEDHGVVARALDHYRANPRTSFSDCLVLEIARKAGHLPVGTFDRRLGSLEGAQRLQ